MELLRYTVVIEANVTEAEAVGLVSQLGDLSERLQEAARAAIAETSYAAQDVFGVTATVTEGAG